jgi:hypothetical protein
LTEIVSYPSPKIPSNLPKANANPGSSVASANNWSSTFIPANLRVSELTKPLRLPLPYRISNVEPFFSYVEDTEESYFACRKQAILVHPFEGTHKLELPVSRTTLNSCGGVPRLISA